MPESPTRILDWPQPGEYEPHDHRETKRPTTNGETLTHYLKAVIGTGVLALPRGFANAGLVVSIVGSVVVAIVICYVTHMLIRSQYQMCRKEQVPKLSYRDGMYAACNVGPACFPSISLCAKYFVECFLISYQLGACSAYIIFVSNNIKEIVQYYNPDITWENRVYMFMMIVPYVLMNYIQSLKFLAPLSFTANLFQYICFVIIFYYLFSDFSTYTLSHCTMIARLERTPMFLGSMFFALCAVGVVLAIETDMKTPKDFRGYFGVLNQGSFIVIVLYLSIAVVAYVKYGDDIAPSLTSNMPVEDVAGRVLRVLYSMSIMFSHALQCYVPLDIIWNEHLKMHISDGKKCIAEYLMRTVIVLITFALAMALPKFDTVISLVGVVCISFLGVAFPAVMDICIFNEVGYGQCNFILIRDICIAITGCFTFVCGTYSTLFTE